MSTAAIALVLLSAILHASWNALLKHTRDTQASAILIVLGACGLSAALAFAVGPRNVPMAAVPWLLCAGLIEGVYFVTLGSALARLPLQSAYGVSRGVGVLLVWPISVFLLGEHATALSCFGAALLSFGLFVQIRVLPRSSGLAFALGCAAAIALYPVCYKAAIDAGIAPFSLFSCSLAMALPLQLVALGRDRRARIASTVRSDGLVLAMGAAACAASFLIFLHALKGAGPAHVSAMRNTSVLFASIYGWSRGEHFNRRALISALAITVGAVCVAL